MSRTLRPLSSAGASAAATRVSAGERSTPSVVRYAETLLPTVHGELRTVVYRQQVDPATPGAPAGVLEHVALVAGDLQGADDVLCRVHSECMTSEVFGSLKCDCKGQLDRALDVVARRGCGVVLYLRQEGRGIGLGNKIAAYALQEQGHDTVDANRLLGLPDDARDYDVAVDMLRDLGVSSVALMTNNPLKVDALRALGMDVRRRVPHLVDASRQALDYLEVKGRRMGHLLDETRPLERAILDDDGFPFLVAAK